MLLFWLHLLISYCSQNWYTSLPGHDFYCEVHEEYIEDDFNLTGEKHTERDRAGANSLSRPKTPSFCCVGLQSQVPFWKEALEMVLDVEPEEDSLTIPDVSIIETSAELLFGLVHQRFILTKAGLTMMVSARERSERVRQASFADMCTSGGL